MATGSTLGGALWGALGLREDGPARSYRAVGWHAQISKLTSSPRGYAAASAAGLDVSAQTLRRWLSETQAPSASNVDKIRDAYQRMAGAFPRHLTGREFWISGQVAIGRDVRDRGHGQHSPLVIDGSAGRWATIIQQYEDGELDAEELEEEFVEDVIMEDLDFSDPPEFHGSTYTVNIL